MDKRTSSAYMYIVHVRGENAGDKMHVRGENAGDKIAGAKGTLYI